MILSFDNAIRMAKLLENPYSHRLPGLGVCTDSRGCDSNPAKCLKCTSFEPKTELLDYYEHDLAMWRNRRDKAVTNGNDSYAQLCSEWIDAYEDVICRVCMNKEGKRND